MLIRVETFLVYSEPRPSHDLGFVDAKATELTFQIADRDIIIRQSPGLLTSNRAGGTTGAVVWKITPLLAQWLTSKTSLLWNIGVIHRDSNVVELGCGISGLLGIALGPLVSSYVLTDQAYVMKVLEQNILANQPPTKSSQHRMKQSTSGTDLSTLRTLCLDWERDSASGLQKFLGSNASFDLVLACDCLYNDFLIRPFVELCTEICTIGETGKRPTVLLIAQQLRSETVFESWAEKMMISFHIWRVTDPYLPEGLRGGSGFVIHLALRRES